MEYRMLSSDTTHQFTTQCVTVEDAKKNIAEKANVRNFRSVDIVNVDTGIIYADEVKLLALDTSGSGPVQVMIGNEDRKFASYLETEEKDPICPDSDEPRFLMPCRHATTPDNLFLRMKSSLSGVGSFPIKCTTPGCDMVWEISDIIKRADLTEDEKIFFNAKAALVSMSNFGVEICPRCTTYYRIDPGNCGVRCVSCIDYTFCTKCKDTWRNGHKCNREYADDVQNILDQAAPITVEFCGAEVPSTRLCPSCKRLIEYDSMCKQMACPCGVQFCFVCLTLCKNSRMQCSGYSAKCRVAPIQSCRPSCR